MFNRFPLFAKLCLIGLVCLPWQYVSGQTTNVYSKANFVTSNWVEGLIGTCNGSMTHSGGNVLTIAHTTCNGLIQSFITDTTVDLHPPIALGLTDTISISMDFAYISTNSPLPFNALGFQGRILQGQNGFVWGLPTQNPPLPTPFMQNVRKFSIQDLANAGIDFNDPTPIYLSVSLRNSGFNVYTRTGQFDNIKVNFIQTPPVPTLSQWGLILLGLTILCQGAIALRRQGYSARAT